MQEGQEPNQPGWVFRPGDGSQEEAVLPSLPETPPGQPPAPAPQPAPTTPVNQPDPVEPSTETSRVSEGEDHIAWTASEYLANPKTASWYTLLAVASFILAALVYVITREVITTAVIAILGILVGIFAARQPQTLQYVIDNAGLHIGEKFYPYSGFKAFSIARDQAIGFIQLLPLKRFMPPLVIHYAPEDEDNIADVLSAYLPFEEHKPDMVDSLTRRLRF